MIMKLHHLRSTMDRVACYLLLLAVLSANVALTIGQGPVYVDPERPTTPIPPKEAPRLDLTTQTVYGFLDFTTTIGNTVMVFSPQSEPSPGTPKPEEKTSPPIIETQPAPVQKVEKVIEIKPSKPISKPSAEKKEEKSSQAQKVSSKVQVVTSSKVTPKKEFKSVISVVSTVINEVPTILSSKVEVVAASAVVPEKKILSKVEVVTGASNIVEAAPKKAIQSKVEVKQGTKVVQPPKKEIVSKVNVKSGTSSIVKSEPQIYSSKVEVIEDISPSAVETQPIFSSVVEVLSSSDEDDDEPPILVANNNIGDPEYDFLSRQPSEVVEETYKVINLRPSKSHKPKHGAKPRVNTPSSRKMVEDDDHPIGLVTTLGGTVVKEGLTTVHETSVIGTFISGKYAQVLHSTSHIFQGSGHKAKIVPSAPLRILKTAAPNLTKHNRFTLEPTPAASLNEETSLPLENLFGSSPNLIRPSRRPSISGGSFKNRRPQETAPAEEEPEVQHKPTPSRTHSNKKNKNVGNGQQKTFSNRYGRPSQAAQLATVSVFSEPTVATYANRRQKSSRAFKSTIATTPQSDHSSRRGYKPRVQPSAVEQATSAPSTSLYKFKLNRTPGRWQYKTTAKPRVEIKKIIGHDETTPLSASSLEEQQNNFVNPQSRSDNLDLELSGSHNGPGSLLDEDANENSIDKPLPVETIKVEISTAADLKDIYYEIATIKSPYTFQVGTVKNTRYITVTSTFQKSFEPTEAPSIRSSEPLTENILATASNFDKENNLLDSSVATLPVLYLAGDVETPPLETLTETFSTTQHMLKTHILPVVYNGINTTSYTLVQTYAVTRLVTATKTLPPMDAYQFVPSKTLNEFNSRLDEAGSELHLELEFGDDDERDEDGLRRSFPPDLDLANIGSDFDLSEVDKSRFPDNHLRHKKAHSSNPKSQQVTDSPPPSTPALTPEQAQQLAFLRLLNPAAAAQIPNVITTSKPIYKIETLYESHVIPFFNGQSSVFSTISRPIATITKTDYEIGTSTLPALPGQQPLNQQFNPQFNFQQQIPQQNPFQITSSPIVKQIDVTETESKVLKLTFGAKTAYTTLYSTKIVPTVVTEYITTSVPVQPTQAFPGYFPSPYGPYGPYVG